MEHLNRHERRKAAKLARRLEREKKRTAEEIEARREARKRADAWRTQAVTALKEKVLAGVTIPPDYFPTTGLNRDFAVSHIRHVEKIPLRGFYATPTALRQSYDVRPQEVAAYFDPEKRKLQIEEIDRQDALRQVKNDAVRLIAAAARRGKAADEDDLADAELEVVDICEGITCASFYE